MLVGRTVTGTTLMSALTTASLTTNLKLCLDAGDSASYTSGQSWLDRSGGAFDFFLGSDGSPGASDPTFAGTAGYLGSYWLFNGSQYFTYDSPNETWMQIHLNNSVFTLIAFYYYLGGNNRIAGTDAGSASNIGFTYDSGATQNFLVTNGVPGTSINVLGTSNAVSSIGWHMVGLSLNEATGAGGGFFYHNGGYDQSSGSDTFNSTYTSPSASNATYTMQLSALGNATSPTGASNKLACLAMWSIALTKANMDTIWTAMRGRFGI